MVRSLYQNSSSMQLLLDRMDVVSNNMANVDTNGYKRRDVFFRQLIGAEQALERDEIELRRDENLPLTHSEDPCCRLRGVPFRFKGDISTYTDYSHGPVKETGNPLDVALASEGFFTIQGPDGIGYTRDGQFKLNENGSLVTADGFFVLGESGPIEITGNALEISQKGHIIVDGNIINQLMIRDFDRQDLVRTRHALYVPSGENPEALPVNPNVQQGYLETSNVNPVQEMVRMISTQRHYETNANLITSVDRVLEKTVSQLGRA